MGKFIIQFSYHFKIKIEWIKYNSVVCINTKGKNKMYDNNNTEVGRWEIVVYILSSLLYVNWFNIVWM